MTWIYCYILSKQWQWQIITNYLGKYRKLRVGLEKLIA